MIALLALALIGAPVDQMNRAELASRIVSTMHPSDSVLNGQLDGWRRLQRALIMRDPVAARLEEKCPNIVEVGIAAAEPTASDELRKLLALGAAKETALLADGMSLPELHAVYAFVSSDTGQRYFRGTFTIRELPDSVVSIADRVRRSDETSFSKNELAVADRIADENGLRQLDEPGRRALQQFRASEAGKKLAQLQPAVNAAYVQSLSGIDAALRQRETSLMQTSMMNYIHAGCGKAK